jgi:hypothetical protein
MFSRLRKRFTYANVAMTLALVFALTGGAFAASSGSGSSPSHATLLATAAKSKGKAGPRGPKGPAGSKGAAGVTGATGPAGSAGAAGAKGENGAAGAEGKEGPPGKEGKPGTEGEEGTPGVKGATGSPWTAGGTLPSGSTETGTWASKRFVGVTSERAFSPISFPVPLAAPLKGFGSATQTHYVTLEEQEGVAGKKDPAECEGEPEPGKKVKGTAEDPQAAKGNLCVYQGLFKLPAEETPGEIDEIKVETIGTQGSAPGNTATPVEGAGTAGAVLAVGFTGPNSSEAAFIWGSWAVTAP